MAGAILNPAGDTTAGVTYVGTRKQYQASGTGNATSSLETITPYDSGTILGNVPPGGTGEKLVSGVVQRASTLLVDSTAGNVGNALVPVSGVGVVPTPPTGSAAADGLSQAPQHE